VIYEEKNSPAKQKPKVVAVHMVVYCSRLGLGISASWQGHVCFKYRLINVAVNMLCVVVSLVVFQILDIRFHRYESTLTSFAFSGLKKQSAVMRIFHYKTR